MKQYTQEELERAMQKCELEPIHQIGQIQPHGCLLALSADQQRIVLQISENLAEFIDLPDDGVHGKPLESLLGLAATARIETMIQTASFQKACENTISVLCANNPKDLQCYVYPSDDIYVLELTPADSERENKKFQSRLLSQLEILLSNMESDCFRYFNVIASVTRELLAFDRVLVYRFDSNWDGEVIAESRAESAESYLGIHFPASDIPPQARRLYLTNLVRNVEDISARPVFLTPMLNPVTDKPLDMSFSALRSLSPVHIEYLSNMGVQASMSISLVNNGKLWGLIACHHLTRKPVSIVMQNAGALISKIASTKLESIENLKLKSKENRVIQFISHLMKNIKLEDECEFFGHILPEFLRLLDASGVIFRSQNRQYASGVTPNKEQTCSLLNTLSKLPKQKVFASENIGCDLPDANIDVDIAAGILVAPISATMENCLILLRQEKIRTVTWGGDPQKIVCDDADDGVRLTPRKSFKSWTQLARGQSKSWSEEDVEAAETLANILIQAMISRSQIEIETKLKQESRKRFETILKTASDGIHVIDSQGKLVEANDAFLKSLGYHANAIGLLSVEDWDVKFSSQKLKKQIEFVLNRKEPFIFETVHQRRDGSRFQVEINCCSIDVDGERYIHAASRDISGRKRNEHLLQDSEAMFRAITENAPLAIAIYTDQEQNYTYLNPTLINLLGYNQEDLSNYQDWWPLAYPDPDYREKIRQEWELNIANSIKTKKPMEAMESTVTCRDGSTKTILWGWVQGRSRNIVYGLDLTERKAQEKELNQHRFHLEELVKAKTIELEQAKEASEVFGFLSDQALELAKSGYWSVNFMESDQYYISSERTVKIFGDPPRDGMRYHIMNDWYVNIESADKAAADATLANYLAAVEGKISRYDMVHPYKRPSDGRIIWVHVLGQVIHNAQGQPTHVYGVVMDVTANKLSEIALRQSKELALKASNAKSEFLANMSHEIRTPMNGVIGMIDVLMQSSLTANQAKIAGVIKESAYAQLAIINDILDFSKIEAGKMELSPEPFLIEKLVESVCVLLDQMALRHDVDLKLFIDPEIPCLLIGDDNRLRQILTNLINNAIKFSSKLPRNGEVYARAELVRKEGQRIWVRFLVRDNGIGISASHQARLFQKFEQADSSTTRNYGGSGLGLVICHRLIALMGGEIKLESQEGKGSEFVFTLPFDVPDEQPELDVSIIKGLPCLIIGPDTGLTADIHVHLSHAGAVVDHIPDIQAITGLNSPDKTLWVWVFDLYGTPSLDDMCAAAHEYQSDLSKTISIQHLAIGRGRRRKARLLTTDVAQIDGNLLTRRSILQAVAILAGIDSPERMVAATESAPEGHSAQICRETALKDGRLILVAEDNNVNQKVIFEQLKLLNLFADIAIDGEDALTKWLNQEYALLLTDIHMPNIDGYELARLIRSESKIRHRKHMPIIALTAVAIKGEAEKCKAVGMDDYLTKPVLLEDLKCMLDKWLPLGMSSHNEYQVKTDASQLMASGQIQDGYNSIIPDWDAEVLSTIIGSNPKDQTDFLKMYIDTMQDQKASIQAALAEADSGKIGKIAHGFKSSSRCIGALRVGDICQSLESAGKNGDLEACRRLTMELMMACEVVNKLIGEALIRFQ